MRIAVVAGGAGSKRAEALESALTAAGADSSRLDLSVAAGETPLERMAGALRTSEAALSEEPPDAVAVTADDDHSLAAALVATKLQIPLYRLEGSGRPSGDSRNADIHALLADATVPEDPAEAAAAILDAVGATAPPRDPA